MKRLLAGLILAGLTPGLAHADLASFTNKLNGDWMNPDLSDCKVMKLRIKVTGTAYTVDIVGFDGSVTQGDFAFEILSVDGNTARVWNPSYKVEQRVTVNADGTHTVANADGGGGVVHNRCP